MCINILKYTALQVALLEKLGPDYISKPVGAGTQMLPYTEGNELANETFEL